MASSDASVTLQKTALEVWTELEDKIKVLIPLIGLAEDILSAGTDLDSIKEAWQTASDIVKKLKDFREQQDDIEKMQDDARQEHLTLTQQVTDLETVKATRAREVNNLVNEYNTTVDECASQQERFITNRSNLDRMELRIQGIVDRENVVGQAERRVDRKERDIISQTDAIKIRENLLKDKENQNTIESQRLQLYEQKIRAREIQTRKQIDTLDGQVQHIENEKNKISLRETGLEKNRGLIDRASDLEQENETFKQMAQSIQSSMTNLLRLGGDSVTEPSAANIAELAALCQARTAVLESTFHELEANLTNVKTNLTDVKQDKTRLIGELATQRAAHASTVSASQDIVVGLRTQLDASQTAMCALTPHMTALTSSMNGLSEANDRLRGEVSDLQKKLSLSADAWAVEKELLETENSKLNQEYRHLTQEQAANRTDVENQRKRARDAIRERDEARHHELQIMDDMHKSNVEHHKEKERLRKSLSET